MGWKIMIGINTISGRTGGIFMLIIWEERHGHDLDNTR